MVLQTQKGQAARSTTQAEFEDIMKKIHKAATQQCREHRNELANPRKWTPLYSFDRARIHNVEKLANSTGIPRESIIDMPHYAPDLQKPVEHFHGWLKPEFRNMLLVLGNVGGDRAKYHDMLSELKDQYPVESIKRDILSLPDTYRTILRPVSEGGSGGAYAQLS